MSRLGLEPRARALKDRSDRGVPLKLWITPANKDDELCVEDARVLWVKDYEFGLEFRRLAAIDRRELALFLEQAARRQSFQESLDSPCQHDMAPLPFALEVKVP